MSKKRKAAIKYADEQFSLYIREKERRCFTCGTTRNLQCGHLISRSFISTRWVEDNGHAQCVECNQRHEEDESIYKDMFIEEYGQEAYDNLKSRSCRPFLKTAEEIRGIGREYKQKYEILKKRREWDE